MKARTTQCALCVLMFAGWSVSWSGCATSTVKSLPPLPPEPPAFVKVPHPEGTDLGDLMAVFLDSSAPAQDELKDCDRDWKKLNESTKSANELEAGMREFVQNQPVKYHWCFYGKLLSLESSLKDEPYVDERQKKILGTYSFVTPLARAFLDAYGDSRYLRMAVARYRRLSEFVFYRRLEVTPQTQAELGPIENPFGLYRPPVEPKGTVLGKYNLLKKDDVPVAQDPNRLPASESASAQIAGDTEPERHLAGEEAQSSPAPSPTPASATSSASTQVSPNPNPALDEGHAPPPSAPLDPIEIRARQVNEQAKEN